MVYGPEKGSSTVVNGLLLVFRVLLTARGVAVAMAGYYPIDTDHTGDKHKGNNAQARIHGFKRFTRGAVPRAPLFRAEHILFLTLKHRNMNLERHLWVRQEYVPPACH